MIKEGGKLVHSYNFSIWEKKTENFTKISSCWWWPKEEIWLLHTHFIQMKNEGFFFLSPSCLPPLLYFMPGISGCAAAPELEEMKVSLFWLAEQHVLLSICAWLFILLLQIKLFTEEDGWWKGTPFIWCLTSSLSSLFPSTSFRPNWALCTRLIFQRAFQIVCSLVQKITRLLLCVPTSSSEDTKASGGM